MPVGSTPAGSPPRRSSWSTQSELRARAGSLGVAAGAEAGDIPADSAPRLIVLAVKPQVIRDVTAAYRRFADGGTVFLSVAAGTPIATFEDILGDATPFVRCMPNTPAAIGKGMMVVFANPRVPAGELAFITDLLDDQRGGGHDQRGRPDGRGHGGFRLRAGLCLPFHRVPDAGGRSGRASPAETAKLLAMQTVFRRRQPGGRERRGARALRKQVTSPMARQPPRSRY